MADGGEQTRGGAKYHQPSGQLSSAKPFQAKQTEQIAKNFYPSIDGIVDVQIAGHEVDAVGQSVVKHVVGEKGEGQVQGHSSNMARFEQVENAQILGGRVRLVAFRLFFQSGEKCFVNL